MGCDPQIAEGGQNDQLISGGVDLADHVLDQRTAETLASERGVEQDPADPRLIALVGPGDGPGKLAWDLHQPHPTLLGPALVGRLIQRIRDVEHESRAHGVLRRVDPRMEGDDRFDVARPKLPANRYPIWRGHRRKLQHTTYCPPDFYRCKIKFLSDPSRIVITHGASPSPIVRSRRPAPKLHAGGRGASCGAVGAVAADQAPGARARDGAARSHHPPR